MRRFLPLAIAAVLPLAVCPFGRADYIYTFTTTTPAFDSGLNLVAGSLSVTFNVPDSKVLVGGSSVRISAADITSGSASFTKQNAPYFDLSTSDAALAGSFPVDTMTGALAPGNLPVIIIQTGIGIFPHEFVEEKNSLLSVEESPGAKGATSASGSGTWTVTHTTPAAPEPATLTLLGVGALGMMVCAWRRRKKADPAAC
jgi:hypothetical protein